MKLYVLFLVILVFAGGCVVSPDPPKPPGSVCGNNVCEIGEDSENCPNDCGISGPVCGDGVCEGDEYGLSCPVDCEAVCGNGFCEISENPQNCSVDCRPSCGNSICQDGETELNCPVDCVVVDYVCGNGICESGETPWICSVDCGPFCGNDICEGGETEFNCSQDCEISRPFCGDNVCEDGENSNNCPQDCEDSGPICGNSVCESGESITTCPQDCSPAIVCGNDVCETGEDSSNCPSDCRIIEPICGNSVCEGNETWASCSNDCDPICDNGVCELGETQSTCSADCGAPVDETFIISHQGADRKYFVHVPASYTENRASALVINFHAGGGGPTGHASKTKMTLKSDEENFIAVHPQGTRRDGKNNRLLQYFWNIPAGPNGPYYDSDDPISLVDDLGFTEKMLNELEANYNIDPNQIYFTGFSNGGMFAQYASCALTPRINGIATVASVFTTFPSDCNLENPVSTMLFFGTEDKCIIFEGGHSECGDVKEDRIFISAAETRDIWLSENNCSQTSEITFQNGETTCTTYSSCEDDSKVTFCEVGGAGHTWPGSEGISLYGEISQDISATNESWNFFQSST